MRIVDIIRRKRHGAELAAEEIRRLVSGYTRGEVPDYQMAAFLMAVNLVGMSEAETLALTEAMLESGEVLDLSDVAGVKVDKHSTGGVGDKTSIALAPLAAAGGVVVPMISGRGLGHTGGTLDKLESIPGFDVHLSLDRFRRVLREAGCALIGQTEEIAPADRKMYALRDVTATVESIPLITASILSKKLAEGIDGLVLDVKVGSGAFMKDEASAVELGSLLVAIPRRMGKKAVALVTDMDQPLGRTVGNALEVAEAVDVLRGGGPEDLRELCFRLAAAMLVLGERAKDGAEGRRRAEKLVDSGEAFERLLRVVELQGGDPRAIEDPSRLPAARHKSDVPAPASGFVASIDAEAIGVGAMILGAGREALDDRIDPAVGVEVHAKRGDRVEEGDPLVTLHYNEEGRRSEAEARIAGAYRIAEAPPAAPAPLVRRVLGAEEISL